MNVESILRAETEYISRHVDNVFKIGCMMFWASESFVWRKLNALYDKAEVEKVCRALINTIFFRMDKQCPDTNITRL